MFYNYYDTITHCGKCPQFCNISYVAPAKTFYNYMILLYVYIVANALTPMETSLVCCTCQLIDLSKDLVQTHKCKHVYHTLKILG
jgi:hypothetical protein